MERISESCGFKFSDRLHVYKYERYVGKLFQILFSILFYISLKFFWWIMFFSQKRNKERSTSDLGSICYYAIQSCALNSWTVPCVLFF